MKLPIKIAERWSDIKANYAFYGITILVLGAISQFIALIQIDTSYLRFFSVSQQIADGLLFSFYLLIIYLSYLLGNFFIKLNKRDKNLEIDDIKRYKKYLLIGLINIPILLAFIYYHKEILSYLFNDTESYKERGSHLESFIIRSLATVFFLTVGRIWLESLIIYLHLQFDLTNWLESKTKNESSNFTVSILAFYAIISIVIVLILETSNSILNFHKSRLIPNNLKRKSILIDNYSKSYKIPKENIKIIYYNDKYIFLSISNKSDSIDILPFESFFKWENKEESQSSSLPNTPIQHTVIQIDTTKNKNSGKRKE